MKNYKIATVAELKELAKKRKIIITGLKRKQEFIDALTDEDGETHTDYPTEARPSKSKAQPSQKRPKKDLRDEIEITIDVGTSKWAVSYVIIRGGKRMRTPQVPHIHAHRTSEVPMVAAWIDGKLVHGDKLEKMALGNPKVADKIIHNFKLALYQDTETSAVTERVERMLQKEGKTLDDLYAELLMEIMADTKESIVRTEKRGKKFEAAEIEAMCDRARVRLTVPQMWRPDARRRMQAAAQKAGMPVVVLASEALCAMAWWLEREAQKNISPDKQFGKGDSILLGDLGAGTGDFAMVEILETLKVNSAMKTIGDSSGALCGLGRVDGFLLNLFLERKGGEWLDAACHELGFTKDDFKRRALIEIEKMKVRFDPEHNELERATIYGVGGTSRTISVSKDWYIDALEPVIREVIGKLDEYVKKRKPSLIVITGGGSRCAYLIDALVNHFGPEDIEVICPNEGLIGLNSPVALGGLLRYDSITKQKLPTQYSYALSIAEFYDKEKHPDEDINKIADLSSYWDGEVDIVEHRIRNIIRKGHMIEDGEDIKHESLLEYRVPKENPHITAEFVFSEQDHKDHVAAQLYDMKTRQYKFRPGVYEWASLKIPIARGLLEGKGFKTEIRPNAQNEKEHFWVILARVVLEYKGEDFRIRFDVIKPGTEYVGEDDDDQVAFTIRDTVWRTGFSEFLQEEGVIPGQGGD